MILNEEEYFLAWLRERYTNVRQDYVQFSATDLRSAFEAGKKYQEEITRDEALGDGIFDTRKTKNPGS